MANAIPVSGKRKAVPVADEVVIDVVRPMDALKGIPESMQEKAKDAIANGRTVSMTAKGNLKIS